MENVKVNGNGNVNGNTALVPSVKAMVDHAVAEVTAAATKSTQEAIAQIASGLKEIMQFAPSFTPDEAKQEHVRAFRRTLRDMYRHAARKAGYLP